MQFSDSFCGDQKCRSLNRDCTVISFSCLYYFFFHIFLAEVVARVQALRLNQNPKDDAIIREKVSDTARLVRDVHQRYLTINFSCISLTKHNVRNSI